MNPAAGLSAEAQAHLDGGGLHGALFYSRRTAETFAALAKDFAHKARIGMLCLSEAIAEPMLAAHFVRVSLADHPSEEGHDGAGPLFCPRPKPGMIEK